MLMVSSCGSIKRAVENRQKKRMERLVQKFSLDSTIYKRDTIVKYSVDTLTIPEIQWDTIHTYQLDTLVEIQRDGVVTELKIMKDTFWLKNTVIERDTVLETKDTTIYVEKIKLVDKTPEKAPNFFNKWMVNLGIGSLILFIFLLFGYIANRLFKYKSRQ
jgi:hypothetical protein